MKTLLNGTDLPSENFLLFLIIGFFYYFCEKFNEAFNYKIIKPWQVKKI